MSDVSGSHCETMCERPRQINIFTLHVTANVSVAPFVSTTVDVPYPNDFTYRLTTFSPSEAATSFFNKGGHAEQWYVRCLRRYAQFFFVVQPVLCL